MNVRILDRRVGVLLVRISFYCFILFGVLFEYSFEKAAR